MPAPGTAPRPAGGTAAAVATAAPAAPAALPAPGSPGPGGREGLEDARRPSGARRGSRAAGPAHLGREPLSPGRGQPAHLRLQRAGRAGGRLLQQQRLLQGAQVEGGVAVVAGDVPVVPEVDPLLLVLILAGRLQPPGAVPEAQVCAERTGAVTGSSRAPVPPQPPRPVPPPGSPELSRGTDASPAALGFPGRALGPRAAPGGRCRGQNGAAGSGAAAEPAETKPKRGAGAARAPPRPAEPRGHPRPRRAGHSAAPACGTRTRRPGTSRSRCRSPAPQPRTAAPAAGAQRAAPGAGGGGGSGPEGRQARPGRVPRPARAPHRPGTRRPRRKWGTARQCGTEVGHVPDEAARPPCWVWAGRRPVRPVPSSAGAPRALPPSPPSLKPRARPPRPAQDLSCTGHRGAALQRVSPARSSGLARARPKPISSRRPRGWPSMEDGSPERRGGEPCQQVRPRTGEETPRRFNPRTAARPWARCRRPAGSRHSRHGGRGRSRRLLDNGPRRRGGGVAWWGRGSGGETPRLAAARGGVTAEGAGTGQDAPPPWPTAPPLPRGSARSRSVAGGRR